MTSRPRFDRPIAHRGLHDRGAGIIENSLSAFKAAIDRGFAIECDVQLSRDGVPMVFHDDELTRLTGREGPVGSFTAEALERLPLLGSEAGDTPLRLTAFLEQVAGRTLLQVELKRQPNEAMRQTLARTAAAAFADYAGPLTVESFDPQLLIAVRRHGYRGPIGIITTHYRDDEPGLSRGERRVLRHLLHWPSTRFDFISCFRGALDLPAVRFFRALGMPVTAWTIRSPEEARAALAAGAGQIVFEGFDPGRG